MSADAGSAPVTYAQCEFAPASGKNMGTVCGGTVPTGPSGETLSFARASVAECYSNDGQTLTQVATDVPAISSGIATSSVLGIWKEVDRDNEAHWARDLSQADWVKSSMTCAKTATGMRNDTNGASTCTATGANGTVLQTVTTGAATRTTSFHLKRRTGTGAVSVTRDNGATWSAVTSSLSTLYWRRVVPTETPGCAGGNCIVVSAMTSGGANPTIGLKFATSGDAVDVDFVQDEPGAYATSPILTTTTWVNRAAVVADIPCAMTGMPAFSVAATMVAAPVFTAGGTALPVVFGDGALGSGSPSTYVWLYALAAGGQGAVDTGGVKSAGFATWSPFYTNPITTEWRNVAFHTGAYLGMCQEGICGAAGADPGITSTLGTPTFTRILLGRYSAAAGNNFSGVIKQVCADPSVAGCYPATRVGNSVWIGDSIIYGTGNIPQTPYVQLSASLGRTVVGAGVGGNTTSQCSSRWTSTYKAASYATLIWSCGVNDVAGGITGATASNNAIAVFNEAKALGMTVIVTGIMPWKNSTGWSAGKNTEGIAYNTAVEAWAVSNGGHYVATATMGGQGGDADILLTTLDSGDLIHPNVAGAAALAALVQPVMP